MLPLVVAATASVQAAKFEVVTEQKAPYRGFLLFVDFDNAIMTFQGCALAFFTLFVFLGAAFDIHAEWYLHDQQRIQQIVLLVGGGLVASVRGPGNSLFGTMPRLVLLALIGFFFLGLMSALLADQVRYALLEWATFWLLWLLALAVGGAWHRDAETMARVARVLIAAVGVALVVKILIGYVASIAEEVRLDTLILFEGAFSNRRFFGQVATLLIPLMAWAVLTQKRYAVAWFALLAVWWMLVFVSGTRGSWAALAAANVAVLFWAGKRGARWGGLQLAAAGVGGVSYWLMFYVIPAWLGMDTGIENRLDNLSTLSAREVIWALAWKQAVAAPWLGIGPMHFAAHPNPVAAHPHNALLQLAAEWGMPATLAVVFLVGYGLWAFLRPLRDRVEPLRLALAVSLLGAVAQSMVDGVIVIPYTQTWLALVAGLALGLHFQQRALPAAGRGSALALRGLTLLALAALLYGVVPEMFDRAEATRLYLEHHDSLAPRFWAQGWIR